jgi:hypothetical protein
MVVVVVAGGAGAGKVIWKNRAGAVSLGGMAPAPAAMPMPEVSAPKAADRESGEAEPEGDGGVEEEWPDWDDSDAPLPDWDDSDAPLPMDV